MPSKVIQIKAEWGFLIELLLMKQLFDDLLIVARGRASVLLSACWSVLGQDPEPQTAPDVLVATLHGSHCHQCINMWNYCKLLWRQKHLPNALNVNVKFCSMQEKSLYLSCSFVDISSKHSSSITSPLVKLVPELTAEVLTEAPETTVQPPKWPLM